MLYNQENIPDKSIERIFSLIRLSVESKEFSIGFVECGLSIQQGKCIGKIMKKCLETEIELKVIDIRNIIDDNLLDYLIKELHDSNGNICDRTGVIIIGLETSIYYDDDEIPSILEIMNLGRDNFPQILSVPIVFFLSEKTLFKVQKYAPDFWSWRSAEPESFIPGFLNNEIKNMEEYTPITNINTALKALCILENLIEVLEKCDDLREEKVNVYLNLGDAYKVLNKYPKACFYYEKAISLEPDDEKYITLLNKIGKVKRELNNFEDAMHYFKKFLEKARFSNNYIFEGTAFNNIGLIYFSQDKDEKALEFINNAIGIFESFIDDSRYEIMIGISNSYGNRGLIYKKLLKYDLAIDDHKKSIAISKNFNVKDSYIKDNINLGSAYSCKKDYKEAIKYFKESLNVSKREGYLNYEIDSLLNLSECFINDDKEDKFYNAYKMLNGALSTSRNIKNYETEYTVLIKIADLFESEKKREKSISFYEEALKNAEKRRIVDKETLCYEKIIQLCGIEQPDKREKYKDMFRLRYKNNELKTICLRVRILDNERNIINGELIQNNKYFLEVSTSNDLDKNDKSIEIITNLFGKFKFKNNREFFYNYDNKVKDFEIDRNNTNNSNIYINYNTIKSTINDIKTYELVNKEKEKNKLLINNDSHEIEIEREGINEIDIVNKNDYKNLIEGKVKLYCDNFEIKKLEKEFNLSPKDFKFNILIPFRTKLEGDALVRSTFEINEVIDELTFRMKIKKQINQETSFRPGRRYALIIGVSEYYNLNNLKAADLDAQELYSVLGNPSLGEFECKLILDQDYSEIMTEIEEFYDNKKRDDVLLLYYSGHGIKDKKRNLYLACKDTNDGDIIKKAINFNYINQIIDLCVAKSQIIILDCSYSGVANLQGEGRIILTSSGNAQKSYEGKNFSRYTEILLEGIKTGNADMNQDGYITYDELHMYVSKRLKDLKINQNPRIKTDTIELSYISKVVNNVDVIIKRYNSNIAKAYSQLNLMIQEDVVQFDLDEMYIPLKINKVSKYEEKKLYDAKDLLTIKDINKIIIKSNPGMGKTTLLRYLSRIESTNNDDVSPVHIRLFEFQESKDILESFIINNMKKFNEHIDKEMILKLLEEGKLLILLDGLDEVKSENYKNVCNEIENFSIKYIKNKIILTTRNYRIDYNNFSDYIFEIEYLSIQEIKNYIILFYNKFENESKTEIKINSLISTILQNEMIFSLARNPFLLSIICSIGLKLDSVPLQRAELYRECLSLLLKRKKRLNDKGKCDIGTMQEVLKEVAYSFFSKGHSEFDYDDLEYFIDKLIKSKVLKNCNECNAQICIESLCNESGVIKEVAYRKYSFLHRTFYEYYVSLKLKELTLDNIIENANKVVWEEPIKLFASQVRSKKEGLNFLKTIWNANKELALKCYPEMTKTKVISKEIVMSLLSSVSVKERIELINGLQYDISKNGLDMVNILNELLKYQKDLEVSCFGILKLEEIKGRVNDSVIIKRINEIIELIEGTEDIKRNRYKKYIEHLMIEIPGGEFLMGSSENEPERCLMWDDEKKKYYTDDNEQQHQVRLSNFKILRYPITMKLFEEILNNEGFIVNLDNSRGSFLLNESDTNLEINWKNDVNGEMQKHDDHPVIHVNWFEAFMFSRLVGCRLPTEAEWEYSCRAGTTTPFNTGENLTTYQANYNGNIPYVNNTKGTYIKNTTFVGSYESNNFGLYDMHGNVLEWCIDWYSNDYYNKCREIGIVENPIGTNDGYYKVTRGGCWSESARNCRSASRNYNNPNYRDCRVGFRIVF